MATVYGRPSINVSSGYVNSVQITGGTILNQGNDAGGGFSVSFQHNNGGCGGADSGIFVELKDTFAWKYISCRISVIGSASCWSFSNSGSAYGVISGYPGTGNLYDYDPAQGDTFVRSYLSVNDSPYTTHSKVTACDNDADNFFRFNTDVYRGFTMVRRRNVNGSLAGIHTGRSCNGTGSGAVTVIDQIRIW